MDSKWFKYFYGRNRINNLNDRMIRLTQYVNEKNTFDQNKCFNVFFFMKNPFYKKIIVINIYK